MKKVAIIGGGPSGLICALTILYKNQNISVDIYEKTSRIGRKIIASGAGKCNVTNDTIPSKYTYNNQFAKNIYTSFTSDSLKEELLKYGIFTKSDSQNRVYPTSESSKALMDIMLKLLEKYNANIYTSTEVLNIEQSLNKYNVITKDSNKIYDYVVLATGGMSSPIHGSNGEGYVLSKNLGIKVNKALPGLVGLTIKNVGDLDGVRVKSNVTLMSNNQKIYEEQGEVQFKKDGISGIVIMNLASIINRLKLSNVKLLFDFVPNISISKLNTHMNKSLDKETMLCGILPHALARKLAKEENIIESLKSYSLDVISTYSFNDSQVTVGGVDISQINENFMVKSYKNLYIVGELLDVDGLCGGYNMHFALASGIIVGKSILGE